jgi:hypothetical protein
MDSSFYLSTSLVDAVWSSFFALFYRKFFWDFLGGTLRDPGGLQYARNPRVALVF